ncbi:MAG: hypothetical protein K6A41_09815 [Bacteroidales bacterium]|nr:hypothetical protein [Bacteroidales bacterium]
MKKAIVLSFLAFFILAITSNSCTTRNCRCYYDVENEIIDTALWIAAGQPIYLKSGEQPIEMKTYIRDTVTYSECSSLNYYDYDGVYMSQSGVLIHSVVDCHEID